MSSAEKLKRRFAKEPPPRDFTWDELIAVMKLFGYSVRSGSGGSHHAFYSSSADHYIRGIPRPHPKNTVLVCYIKLIKKSLVQKGLISGS